MQCLTVGQVTTLIIQHTSTFHRHPAQSTIPKFPWIIIPQDMLGMGLAPQAGEALEDTVLVSATACLTVVRTPPTIIRDPEESSGSVTASAFASSR